MLIYSVVFSLVAFFLMVLAVWISKGPGPTWVAVIFLVLAFNPPHLLLLLQFASIIMIGLFCYGLECAGKTFVKLTAAVILIAHGLAAFHAWGELREHDALRAHYPAVSVAERLRYEDRPTDLHQKKTDATYKHLQIFENKIEEGQHRAGMSGPFRETALRNLHKSAVWRFVNSPGFGFGRMSPNTYVATFALDPDSVRNDEGGPIPLNTSEAYLESLGTVSEKEVPADILSQNKLLSLHWRGVSNFLNPYGLGVFESRERVLGFKSHRFREDPDLMKDYFGDPWRVTRLELVSLLKFETPRVYVSDYLPRMDELKSAETRALDDFERAGLQLLLAGEDLRFEKRGQELVMFGSLRAAEQCLKCHAGERGDLLGAFSYTLQTTRP